MVGERRANPPTMAKTEDYPNAKLPRGEIHQLSALLDPRKKRSADKMQLRPGKFVFSRFFASSDQQMSQARLWNAVAGRRECGTFGCSGNVWFTRAQARAYAACGGGGRKRPRLLERGGAGRRGNGTLVAAATSGSPVLKHGPMPPAAEEGRKRPRLLERGGAGRRGNGTLVAAATSGSPVLKHGPMPPAAEEGVNALGSWNADARGGAGMERWLQRQRLVHPCSSTGLCRLRRRRA
jgi:hypothetical protein